jgi:DNA-binding MarR family transcriptional regulator
MATRRRQPATEISEPSSLTADQFDAWKAIVKLMARLPAALEQQLRDDSQLSYLEYHVLAHLSGQPQRAARMCQLADMADAEQSRMSHLISRLERRGFVRREADPADRRSNLAILTDAGHAHLAAAAPRHVDRVRELVIDALTPEALLALKDASNRVTTRIEKRRLRPPRPSRQGREPSVLRPPG